MIRVLLLLIWAVQPATCAGSKWQCDSPIITVNGVVLFPDSCLPAGKDLYLVGEIHENKLAPSIKLATIKWLYQHEGINNVYMEIGTAAAYLYNCYLTTGDTSFISQPRLVYNHTAVEMDFWRKLYQWNNSIKANITIRGFDFERMEFLTAMKRAGSMPFSDTGSVLLHNVDSFSATQTNSGNLTSLLATFRQDAQKHIGDYKHHYAANHNLIQGVLNNRCTYPLYQYRDSLMFSNVLDSFNATGNCRAVIFAGRKHGLLPNRAGTLFSRLVNNDSMGCKVGIIEMRQPDPAVPQPYYVKRFPVATSVISYKCENTSHSTRAVATTVLFLSAN